LEEEGEPVKDKVDNVKLAEERALQLLNEDF